MDNVKKPFLKEHPEKRSRSPRGAGSKEDRREAAKPSAGTNQPDARKYKSSTVTTVDPDKNKGACLAAGLKQRTTDDGSEASNPKHRTTNSWGVPDKK
jgi:hypothetical protein